MNERVLLVSIDGVAARSIDARRTPNLCRLARAGGGCFHATTVDPPITVPAHASMLRGVSPSVHGAYENDHVDFDRAPPSILEVAREGGQTTAMATNWLPLDRIVEAGAVRDRRLIHGGYAEGDDDLIVDQATSLLRDATAELVFVYFCGPDLAGHKHGWDSDAYNDAVSRADGRVGELMAAANDDVAIVVTTDHGGNGVRHAELDNETMKTFVVARSRRIPPASCWTDASILDIAPTIAELLGLHAPPSWEGSSLVGRAVPVVDWIMSALAAMADHHYGEDLDMLSHSLQTAARARADGADAALILAGLLHDVGHTLGPVTEWGYPEHDNAGALALQPWFAAEIVEPVRLHVAAKRFLVAVDPAYVDALSRASVESLRQQGGPFSPGEVSAFEERPGALDAMALRRWDDGGKVAGLDVAPLESYREMVESALSGNEPVGAHWARDSCRCPDCRDPQNGQRLFDAEEIDGWSVVSTSRNGDRVSVVLARGEERHTCLIDEPVGIGRAVIPWGTGHPRRHVAAPGAPLDGFLADLSNHGISLAVDIGSKPETVLRFAERIGFVRHTNYGALFDVVTEPDPINLAYTPKGLPLHTDNPYRDPVPTVQLLHCLRAASQGGASRFCDGFAVAEELRMEEPGDFEVLTTTLVTFRFSSDDTDLRAEVPLILLDSRGRVVRVTVNNRSMEPLPPGPGADRFYEAYVRFAARLAEPAHSIELTLAAGELVAFDNRRVLHGRSGFSADPDRHLQGCYVDIDAVHSSVIVAGRAERP